MKKIIVLGMFFVSYSLQILSAQENPAFALLLFGITFAGLKVGTDRLQQISDTRSSFVVSKSASPLQSDSPSFSLPDSHKSTPVGNRQTTLRGLRHAKRDKIYVADTNSPSSIVDLDCIDSSSIQNLMKTHIPFPVSKKSSEQLFKPVTTVQFNAPVSPLRTLSPDDYHQVNLLCDDEEDEGFVVCGNR